MDEAEILCNDLGHRKSSAAAGAVVEPVRPDIEGGAFLFKNGCWLAPNKLASNEAEMVAVIRQVEVGKLSREEEPAKWLMASSESISEGQSVTSLMSSM